MMTIMDFNVHNEYKYMTVWSSDSCEPVVFLLIKHVFASKSCSKHGELIFQVQDKMVAF